MSLQFFLRNPSVFSRHAGENRHPDVFDSLDSGSLPGMTPRSIGQSVMIIYGERHEPVDESGQVRLRLRPDGHSAWASGSPKEE